MKNKERSERNGLFYLLLSVILLLIFFSYKKYQDYNKLQDVFVQEKKAMKSELEELIDDYKDLTVKRKGLSKRLVREMNKIIALRDSVQNLKKSNYQKIVRYRKRITTLERENRDLFIKVDSLNVVAKFLEDKNLIVSKELTEEKTKNSKLSKVNKNLQRRQKKLESKVAEATIIKTTTPVAIAMKERMSGKLTNTSRSSRTDAFKVTFKMLPNKIATSGERKIYVQILDKNNNTVADKGTIKLKNGSKISYSDELTANYKNQTLNVLSLILVNRDDIEKGIYTVNVYLEGRLKGKTTLKLR